jgi:hypothetical protein
MSAEIKFARDYGVWPVAPFFLVWNEDGNMPRHKHETRELAEAEAARLAASSLGSHFHVLGVMATITTSADIVGQRFDPARHKPQPVVDADPEPPEFAEVDEAPNPPAAPASVDEFGDDKPF